jgi:lysophospholipase L1-like esterase
LSYDAAGRRGLVALGDSITRGRGGTPALGVHFQSWAQWLAEALELPFTNLAADGALAADVLAEQVPRLAGPYDVGCLYVGVNDTRAVGWEAAGFERDVRAIVAALEASCDRVVVVAPPHDLGRPRAAPKPAEAGAVLRRVAADAGVLVCALAQFGGRREVLPDAVHPTSAGELAIADEAARALGAERMPSALAEPLDGRLHRARFGAWWARLWVRDVVRRAWERWKFRRVVG